MNESTIKALKAGIDATAMGVAFATVFKWLPIIAAALSIAWTLWRFYEAIRAKIRARQASADRGDRW